MTRGRCGVATGMEIEVWSDVVCPWCYIGKRHLEEALRRFPHRDDVSVRWRAFELDPSAPPSRDGSYVGRLAEKYGTGAAQAQQMVDQMTARAAESGLAFRFDLARPGNTFDAHRVLHFAAERGRQDEVKERLLAATFGEGAPVSDHDTLVRLAVEAGLDAEEVRAVLDGDRYGDAVRAEEREAAALGATGVPFFVVDRAYGMAGAQPPQVLLQLLERAWADAAAPLVVAPGGSDGSVCASGSDDAACAV